MRMHERNLHVTSSCASSVSIMSPIHQFASYVRATYVSISQLFNSMLISVLLGVTIIIIKKYNCLKCRLVARESLGQHFLTVLARHITVVASCASHCLWIWRPSFLLLDISCQFFFAGIEESDNTDVFGGQVNQIIWGEDVPCRDCLPLLLLVSFFLPPTQLQAFLTWLVAKKFDSACNLKSTSWNKR